MRTARLLPLFVLALAGAEEERGTALLRKRLQSPDWVVRALAAKSVGDTRYANGIPLVRDRLLGESSDYVMAFGLRALAAFPPQTLARVGGKELFPAALKGLQPRSEYVREQAEALLEKLAGRKEAEGRKGWEAWWEKEGPAFAFSAAPAAPQTDGTDGVTEAKTHKESSFEEYVYDARRRGLEVVFVLDQTGSMAATIQAARESILEICDAIHLLVPKHRAGLVTYDDLAQVKFPLTKDYGALQGKLSRVRAGGGGDSEEGVDKGMAAALDPGMGWTPEARKVLIVIGDAPPRRQDEEASYALAESAAKRGWVVNAILVGGGAYPLRRIAELGKGDSADAGGSKDRLIEQMLILSLGREHEKALAGFLEVARAVKAPKARP